MIGYIATWAAAGFGVRCYQLGLMKRNIFENLGGHVLSMGAFSGLGYYFYNADIRQRAILAEKKESLLRMRDRAASLAVAGEEGEHH